MLNKIRLMLIAAFMGLFLIACGEESSTEQTAAEPATAEASATEEMAADAETPAVEEGMTEEAAIAKWGEPTIKQTRTLDSLTITNMEWHNEDGIISIQFQNGKEKYNQFIPAE